MRILAVDDDPALLRLLTALLDSGAQHKVSTAQSGQEALDRIAAADAPFECFLLDMSMPGMDGAELCRTIRRMPQHELTPIIMITANSEKAGIDSAFHAGATDYIVKPIQPRELRDKIHLVSQGAEQAGELHVTTSAGSHNSAQAFEFEAALPILVTQGAVQFTAMQNYLITLGLKRLYGISAIAIGIENAERLHSQRPPEGFLRLLGDVANAVTQALAREQIMLAYAGSGVFVCLSSQHAAEPPAEIAARVNGCLTDLARQRGESLQDLPVARVGRAVRGTMFSRNSPTRILDQAIGQLQQG